MKETRKKKNVHIFTLSWFKHDRSTIDDDDGNGDDENKCACVCIDGGEPTYA